MGLTSDLEAELQPVLQPLCASVSALPRLERLVSAASADVILCPPERQLVSQLRLSCPGTGIVVVTRLPEIPDWLDSLEAGADDYCASPFESVQLKWILDNSLRSAKLAA